MQSQLVHCNRTLLPVASASRKCSLTAGQITTKLQPSCLTPLKTQLTRPTLAAKTTTRTAVLVKAAGGDGDKDVKYNTVFGYSRKDVILIGVGIIGFGYGLYYGLQAAGVPAIVAGNYVQLFVFLGICVGWIGSYLFRVANKDMTYAKQLKDYEEAVMAKRLEEMPEAELEKLMEDLQKDKKN